MKVSIAEKNLKLEKDQLVKLLTYRLNWTRSILKSLSKESLYQIYKHVLKRNPVFKAKVSEKSSENKLSLYLPKELRDLCNLKAGDRVIIDKANFMEKEVYIHFSQKGNLKISSTGSIHLPCSLADKKLLKGNDDALLVFDKKNNRISVKSFSFMQ